MKNFNELLVYLFEFVISWLMIDVDRRFGFVLGNDFIMFYIIDYDNYVFFILLLIFGLSKVFEFVKLLLVSWIGF